MVIPWYRWPYDKSSSLWTADISSPGCLTCMQDRHTIYIMFSDNNHLVPNNFSIYFQKKIKNDSSVLGNKYPVYENQTSYTAK